MIGLGMFLFSTVWAAAPAHHDELATPSRLGREPLVRVRLASHREKGLWTQTLQGTGLRFEGLITQEVPGPSQWNVECDARGVRVIRTDGRLTRIHAGTGLTVKTHAGILSFGSLPYRGELRIYSTPQGCDLVNSVGIESYIAGLLNSEFSSRFPREAIEAQAIAARSYALAQMEAARKRHFDVESTVIDQVYEGAIKEDSVTQAAARATRGMVLSIPGGPAPFVAFYHSTCGGETELPGAAWGTRAQASQGYKKRVKCGFCQISPKNRWSLTLTQADLTRALAGKLGLAASHALHWSALVPLREGLRRVARVRLLASVDGVPRSWEVAAQVLREGVGTQRLPSLDFVVSRPLSSQGVELTGRGYGHGVGMCQWGAVGMAKQGFKRDQILGRYYPEARMQRRW